ncbi:MAG: MoxR family ATPase [Rhodospirillales bacterium]|nr:MoxR family ATPase [Rhodospirillales bacterium]MCB9997084.1 MoxR family ATPase [Rhodospirillales bacterium]
MSVRKEIQKLQDSVAREIIGQEEIVECLIAGILANGNLLVESLPGLAKTRAIKTLSKNIESTFSRIQFTPDLTSKDIAGQQVYEEPEGGGKGMYRFEPGPIFNNIVLADEVNRSPPKTQNALLEAMEERQVTVGGQAHKVPDLFMVMATMNPAGQQGTFPMPEAQMDRFLMHVMVDYPDEEAEAQIIRLIRDETAQENKGSDIHKEERNVTAQETIFAARAEIDKMPVPAHVEKYMVDLIFATRYPQRYTYELKSFIAFGCSPRASIALDRVVRTNAWMNGQDRVEIENVQKVLPLVFRHRIIRGERAVDHKITTGDICEEIIELVPVPSESKAKEG